MGRPTALTPAIQSRFVSAIADGGSVTVAAQAAGIHRATAYRWLAEEGDFCDAVEAARSGRVTRWLRYIEDAASGKADPEGKQDWRAAAWLLERCDTEEFGKSVRTSVQEEIQSFLAGLKGRLGSQAWREVLVAASEQAGPGVVRGRSGDGASADH